MDFPTVSIIMTHWGMDYERNELFRRSLESLFNSVDNLPVEIIVVSNGGHDKHDINKWLAGWNYITVILNPENMSFGYARNQALSMAIGEYICIVDNDLIYRDGWLERCLEFLQKHPGKFYTTPMAYPTPGGRYHRGFLDGWELNMRAGSNCWVMRRKDFDEVGRFECHRIAGSRWTDQAVHKGYLAAVDPESRVDDIGLRKGYDLSKTIPIKKTLLNGREVYFNTDEHKIPDQS